MRIFLALLFLCMTISMKCMEKKELSIQEKEVDELARLIDEIERCRQLFNPSEFAYGAHHPSNSRHSCKQASEKAFELLYTIKYRQAGTKKSNR